MARVASLGTKGGSREYEEIAKDIIAKGGVKSLDEANLSLGRAYVLNNNNPEDLKTFALVTSPEYRQLATLWSIHVGQL